MFGLDLQIDKAAAKNLSPLILAYIGDAVYSLYTRERLVCESGLKVSAVHKLASSEVSAVTQADHAAKLLPFLDEEEKAVYRRARNAKKGTRAKHATVAEYNMSTGFEAVIGYLYLSGKTERLNELLNLR